MQQYVFNTFQIIVAQKITIFYTFQIIVPKKITIFYPRLY